MASEMILIFMLFTKFYISYGAYKLCAFPTMEYHHCRSIEVGNSNVSCVQVVDSVDCAIKLREGKADFALYSPEEAVLLETDTESDVDVIGEVRDKLRADDSVQIQMVAIIRKEFSGKFYDLRGKRYCHPGVGISHRLTDHFLTYFERKVVSSPCRSQLTAAEQEVSAVHDFFGDSCRPGVWAQTRSLDRKLKWYYSKLCRLCDSTAKCKYNLDRSNSFEAALQCLTRRSGEITYVPLQEAKKYFGLNLNMVKQNNAEDYAFLCKNETVMSINSKSPCIWSKQPWDLLISRKDVSADLRTSMSNWLGSEVPPKDWRSNLKYLLLGRYKFYLQHNGPDPLRSYLNRGGVDDEINESECRSKVRWCTLNSIENEKCVWVSKAGITHGFKPFITCIRGRSLMGCLQNIAQNKADIMSISTEYGFIAKKVFNLKTTVYEDNSLNGNYKILAVLRNDNQNINSFRDLRGRRACFPEYNGLGWISFINIGNAYNVLGNTCPEYYFGPSCVPGAFNTSHTIPGSWSRPQSMCNICPTLNYSDPCTPQGSLDVNAIMCLSKGKGEIAFVNYQGLLSGRDGKSLNELITPNLYKVLCKNGTIVNGLTVDDECALSTGISAEVIGGMKSPNVRADIVELLLELDKSFGTIAANEEGGVMRMYDEFKGEKNILFRETTIALANSDEDLNYNEVNSYVSMLSNITDCRAGASNIFLSLQLLTASILSWLILF